MTQIQTTSAIDLVPEIDAAIVEQVVLGGDLSALTPTQRVSYYAATCRSLGLNPLTKPFDYLRLSGRLVLYARRDATDQIRSLRGVSITITARELIGDVYIVTARASTPDGRTDESTGAVSVSELRGDALANAYLKAETKAKRRVTLSICGLGMMDESEISSVPDAHRVQVDAETGEILDAPHVPHPAHPAADPDPFGDVGTEAEADDGDLPWGTIREDDKADDQVGKEAEADADVPNPPGPGGEDCNEKQYRAFMAVSRASGWGTAKVSWLLGTVLSVERFGGLSKRQASWAIDWVRDHPQTEEA